MIDYEKQAHDIFSLIVSTPVLSTMETVKRVEERIRKIGNIERGEGYHDRMREEHTRHSVLKEQLDAARNRLNTPQVG